MVLVEQRNVNRNEVKWDVNWKEPNTSAVWRRSNTKKFWKLKEQLERRQQFSQVAKATKLSINLS